VPLTPFPFPAGYWLLVTGYWLLVTGYCLLVTGYWSLVTGHWLLVTGYCVYLTRPFLKKATRGDNAFKTTGALATLAAIFKLGKRSALEGKQHRTEKKSPMRADLHVQCLRVSKDN
jgi:hypothetical protein